MQKLDVNSELWVKLYLQITLLLDYKKVTFFPEKLKFPENVFIILDSSYKRHFDEALSTMTIDGTLQMLKERWTQDRKRKDMVSSKVVKRKYESDII